MPHIRPTMRRCLTGENRNKKAGRRDKQLWMLDADSGPLLRLSGHCAPVTAVALSTAHNVVLSGAADGMCLLHSLKDGCAPFLPRCGRACACLTALPPPLSFSLCVKGVCVCVCVCVYV